MGRPSRGNLVVGDRWLGLAPLFPVGARAGEFLPAGPFFLDNGKGLAGNDGPSNIEVVSLFRDRSCNRILVAALRVDCQ